MTLNNSQLGFNISKATPTTSTTNTNTTSTPPSSAPSIEPSHSPVGGGVGVKSSFFQNILSKSSTTVSATTEAPSTPTETVAGSQGDPATPVYDFNGSLAKPTANSSSVGVKSDLIGLFDKFDISSSEQKQPESNSQQLSDGLDHAEEHTLDESKSVSEESKEKSHLEKEDDGNSTQDTFGAEQSSKDESQQIETVEKNVAPIITIPRTRTEAKTEDVDFELEDSRESELIQQEESEESGPKEKNQEAQDVQGLSLPSTEESRNIKRKDLIDITGDVEEQSSEVEEFVLKVEETRPSINRVDSNRPRHDSHISSKINQSKVDPEEQYQQSHRPFDFQHFLAQLRRKSADPVVRYIRSFLVNFSRQGHTFTADQRINILVEFKKFMNDKFTLYEPFASMDEIDLENSREGLEKLIMNRLHIHCFPPEVSRNGGYLPEPYVKDLDDDNNFATTLEKFSWVNGTHLDIEVDELSTLMKGEVSFMDYGIAELNKINKYRAPRDKIICILNACKIIFSYLKVSNQETNADAFIPLLILIIIKAKTDHLISNIHYIEGYRGEEWLLHGETSYYLSSLQAAIGFIQNLGFDELTITEEEYNAHMEAWDAEEKQRAIIRGANKDIRQPQPQRIPLPTEQSVNQQSLSPSSVLLSSAEMFTKSISNFLSPSPSEQMRIESELPAQLREPVVLNHHELIQPQTPQPSEVDSERLKEVYNNVKEIFPTIDTSILKDLVYINRGDIDKCIDACLQFMGE
ncbi:predicted protein [Scheffersomyces stipitis CBS 6054]|uniref:Uncharacterized protein n=1 Tax=Scheffersomyces stipitis (strain ATCC 58785 / CBS 6054 / NBRC 10063 / NRRL Y-11545) TaxID=322104 RepID=A3LTH4_PICST|nr:predicted protein [Scheffersomyces stipitis CBS 6054]ABN66407.2 predicted protein [Scheffersomyces stipitis CBS 6054]